MNVGGTQLVLDRARRVGARAVRARLVELAVRCEPARARTASTRTRRSRPTWRTGARSSKPNSSCSAATTAATSRRSSSGRRGSTDRSSPSARRSSSRPSAAAGSRSSARARNAVRWSTRATSCRACCSPRSPTPRPATRTGSPTPSRTRCATCCGRCATRSRPRACSVSHRRPLPVPHLAGVVAEKLDGLAQASGRYVQVLHVLGELKDTIACDISPGAQGARLRADGRAARRHAGERALVPRARRPALMARTHPRHRRQRLLRLACSPSWRSPQGDAVRIFDLNPPGPDARRRRVRRRRRARPGRGARRVRRRRRRVPQRRAGAAREGPRAVRRGERRRHRERARRGARRARRRRSCTRRRARCSASPSTIR